MGHETGADCGCCLEPVDDRTEPSDLCSEATGTNNGTGWRIRRCPLHAAAPALLEALKKIRDTLQDDCTDAVRVGAGCIAIAAIEAAERSE